MVIAGQGGYSNAFSCELEDWFHILGSDRVPDIADWPELPLRAEASVERLLQLFEETGVRATFFCLGWMAQRMPHLVRKCQRAGHEIGSHGYGHVLAYDVGREAFRKDVVRAKAILEDITGSEVVGFRVAGFSVTSENRWVFDVVAEAGHTYDASVFPTGHAHGGLRSAQAEPHVVETRSGSLVEIPVSTVTAVGRRVCLFGGGYLRITPLPLLRWGVEKLRREGRPLVVYIHPREIDPDHPQLRLRPWRRFKCYANLRSTMPKLRWLCEHHAFTTMQVLATEVVQSDRQEVPEKGAERVVLPKPLPRLRAAARSAKSIVHTPANVEEA
jgi:polysaccharide deacetylase family protein (PEP-CTERM system associated)